MANTVFKLRRSSVAGKVPNTSTLSIGELALNLTDRKLYSSDGTDVWETGSNLSVLSVGSISANGSNGTSGQVLTTNGSNVYWSTLSAGGFVNGQSISVNNFVVTGSFTANSSNGTSGQVLKSNGSSVYWGNVVTSSVNISYVYQSETGNGSTTNYIVNSGYDANNLNVYINGVRVSGAEVNVSSGSNVVFNSAPVNGSIIEFVGYITGSDVYYVKQNFIADGSSNAFYVPGGYTASQLNVYLNGSRLSNSEIDTSSGSNIVFNSTPVNGAIIDVWGFKDLSPAYSPNTASQYTWTNTHTFTNIVTFSQTINGTANSSLYLGSVAANSYVQNTDSRTLSGNLVFSGANNQFLGTTRFGNGTFVKSGSNTGDILLDNNSTDTPGIMFYYANNTNFGIDSENQNLRFVKNLNESGGAPLGYFDTDGNLTTTGYLAPQKWQAGQVIKDIMLSNAEVTVVSTTIATSGSTTNFITYNYTPLSASSYLIVHFHLSKYTPQGTTDDSWYSTLSVDGSEIAYSWQMVNDNGSGTSGRSGVLFPLTGRFTNSNTAVKQIQVGARRDSADDSITIDNSATSMWLRITEIAR